MPRNQCCVYTLQFVLASPNSHTAHAREASTRRTSRCSEHLRRGFCDSPLVVVSTTVNINICCARCFYRCFACLLFSTHTHARIHTRLTLEQREWCGVSLLRFVDLLGLGPHHFRVPNHIISPYLCNKTHVFERLSTPGAPSWVLTSRTPWLWPWIFEKLCLSLICVTCLLHIYSNIVCRML
jgi:hypothetical protein